jgi:hypothetical protein
VNWLSQHRRDWLRPEGPVVKRSPLMETPGEGRMFSSIDSA